MDKERYCGSCGFDREDKNILMCPGCNSTWWTDDSKVLGLIRNLRMTKYRCPVCGGNAPESGGVYNKSYSAEENGMKYFCFPVYMCNDCELEFVINGGRIVDGKTVWQDPNVKREDWAEDGW